MAGSHTKMQAVKNGVHGDRLGFQAVLSPYRSLSPRGFFIFMCLISGICFISGMVFVLNGAWPVMGFLGLDVLIIYIAFKLNYRSGRQSETIDLTRNNLILTRTYPSGVEEMYEFNPYWVRVKVNEGRDGRTELALYHHDRHTIFGKFLTDDERREFGVVLKNALLELKGGMRI